MRMNQIERLRRKREYLVEQRYLRVIQIETMIAEFGRICADLGQQIETEEKRVRISDPAHFAYPTYARAARERRARIERSASALRIELDTLRCSDMVSDSQVAA
jgi:flagellar protein FliJ